MARDQTESGLLETSAEKTSREQAEEKRTEKRHRNLQLFFNGVLMASTILTAAIMWFQSGILKNTLEETRRQAKSSEDAVKVARDTLNASIASGKASDEQAKAAREAAESQSKAAVAASAKLNQEAIAATTKHAAASLAASVAQMRLDQRAWLGVDGDRVRMGNQDLEKGIAFDLPLLNTGKTPALRVMRFAGYIALPPMHMPDIDKIAYENPNAWSNELVLQPQEHDVIHVTIDDAYLAAHRDAIRQGTEELLFYGLVTYFDIFQAKHWTHFCYALMVSGRRVAGFKGCPVGNETN